jgi:hypothetical protein
MGAQGIAGKCREHQHNADVHHQPLPESISEEREIGADDNGNHRYHVQGNRDPSVHGNAPFPRHRDVKAALGKAA